MFSESGPEHRVYSWFFQGLAGSGVVLGSGLLVRPPPLQASLGTPRCMALWDMQTANWRRGRGGCALSTGWRFPVGEDRWGLNARPALPVAEILNLPARSEPLRR